MSLYGGRWCLSDLQSDTLVVMCFFLLCYVSHYSGLGLLSGMQCVTLRWQWVSLCFTMCHSVGSWFSLVGNVAPTVVVGFSLLCNMSLYIGSGLLSVMQCVTLEVVGFSLVCNVAPTVAVGFALICNFSLYSRSAFHSDMQ